MEVCNPSCVTTIPSVADVLNKCNLSTRKGGIPRLTFLKCDPNLELPFPALSGQTSPYQNLENIKWLLCNGYLNITGELVGQKPKGSVTKKRLSSCAPEVVVAGQKTVTFFDYNADNDTLIDYDFWQSILDNQQFLFFGFIDCNDFWYQYDGTWSLELDEVKEDNSETGLSSYDGTVVMATKDLLKPLKVEGLLAFIRSFKTSECYS